MISISKITPSGTGDSIIIRDYKSKLYETQLRVSKTKTLDGGVVIVNSGFSEEDKKFVINAKLNKADSAALRAIYEEGVFIIFASEDGIWQSIITSLNDAYGTIRMIVEVKVQLNA